VKRVTIRDIAARLRLSPATVSAALTGRRNGTFVGDETRNLVWQTARDLGYRLERLRARHQPLQSVAVFAHPYFQYMNYAAVHELCQLLSRQGCRVLMEVDADQGRECRTAKRLYSRGEIDGAIFLGSRAAPEDAQFGSLPCVVLGELPEGVDGWHAVVDNRAGGRMVGEHLWSLGHRAVGMVYPEPSGVVSQLRLEGLRSVWLEHGLDFPDNATLVVSLGHENELIERLPTFLQENADRGRPLTGLFCFNDYLAVVARRVLRDMGLRIPRDISIVGFDDGLLAQSVDPPLTTVRVPYVELCSLAAQLLLQRVNAPDQPARSHILAPTLVVRGSTAPAPQPREGGASAATRGSRRRAVRVRG
jgi:DNA-binding LacI/PurR family transcriptional regulator